MMQVIMSLAQVGSSLGVHLILASLKPAGTVDDKIWSNARFRLCLKVQDKQDSMDMLKNGDAAMLTAAGQCYIQIGNQEYYELFQTGYCGGAYREGEQHETGAVLVSNTGKRTEPKSKFQLLEEQNQVQVLTDYVARTAKDFHYKAASQLWLEELPDILSLENLKMPEKRKGICLRLGLCDDPERQRQILFDYQPLMQGHLAVCGGPATGKTTFLQTILWQLCGEYSPDQVQVLAVSMWQESFACFYHMPGCLGILKDGKDKEIFFYHLEGIIIRRRKLLSGIGCQQFNKSGRKPLPYIFLVIDNYGSLRKELNENQEELILKLVSEGISLGIFVILTMAAVGEIGNRIFGKIKNTAALEMGDRFQYGDILRQYYLSVLPKENTKGRGVCKIQGNVLEFQGAVVFGEKEDYERICLIDKAGKGKTNDLKSKGVFIPDKLPFLPAKPVISILLKNHEEKKEEIPIGYCYETGEVCSISLKEEKVFFIVGREKTGRRTLLSCMTEGFLKLGGQTVVIDEKRQLGHFKGRDEVIYLGNKEELIDWMGAASAFEEKEPGKNRQETEETKTGIFVSDLESLCHFIYGSGDKREEKIIFWEQIAKREKKGWFLAGIYNPVGNMEATGTTFFREALRQQQGICLGGNVGLQRVLDFDDLGYANQNKNLPPGIGYFKEGAGSRTRKLLLPVFDLGNRH